MCYMKHVLYCSSGGTAPMLNLGETVYLATSIANLDNYVVKNLECYATKSSDPSDKTSYYPLSTNTGFVIVIFLF